MAETVQLTIKNKNQTQSFRVRKGLGLLAISKKYPIGIEFDCCKADCGICIFTVISGDLSVPTNEERDFLKAMHAQEKERLACQTRIFGDATIQFETFT